MAKYIKLPPSLLILQEKKINRNKSYASFFFFSRDKIAGFEIDDDLLFVAASTNAMFYYNDRCLY
jgi:hypothetical protein